MKALCVEVVYVFKFVCERSVFNRDVCSRLCVREVCVKEVCVEVCVFASPSATPATQNERGCRQAPRLPRKTMVDVAKRHACHAK